VEWLQATRVELGDGPDEVRSTRPGPAPIGGVVAFGGPGDDLLDGGAGFDVLDGGGGTDTLLGGAGSDRLADGDADATVNADLLDGGDGTDTVSYATRRAPVRVGLGDMTPDGAPGEGDTVRGIEDAVGGHGADRLTGDGGANELHGGAGNDTLGGGDAGDRLFGGPGDDTVRGGDGADVLGGEHGSDRVACGRGIDLVHEPRRGEWLAAACETIRYAFGAANEDSLLFSPHPFAAARFSIGCPHREALDGEPSRCDGTLTLREAASARRLIGRGRLAGTLGREARPVRVALTTLGRRLARRHDGVDVTATVAGRGLPTRCWSITLRVGG
jgi:hypothetical protein